MLVAMKVEMLVSQSDERLVAGKVERTADNLVTLLVVTRVDKKGARMVEN